MKNIRVRIGNDVKSMDYSEYASYIEDAQLRQEAFWRKYDLPNLHLWETGFVQGDATDSEVLAVKSMLGLKRNANTGEEITIDDVLEAIDEQWEKFREYYKCANCDDFIAEGEVCDACDE